MHLTAPTDRGQLATTSQWTLYLVAGAGRLIRPRKSLASDECQEIRIYHVVIRGHHAVRETGVDLERAMLEQLRLQECSVFVGDNLIIVALHHEGRNRNRFQIVSL